MDKLYVGFDIGTHSLGWVATDEEYNVKRIRGKKAWGARIFSPANSKAETRKIRSNRRRMARRKYRIQLLQELFAEEISKVDKTFFARLDNSMYRVEDKKNVACKQIIFTNADEEKEFYSKYPTIWHLRKALINNEEYALSNLKHVYLALHHIIKYRGNFLLEGSFNIKKLDDTFLEDLNCFLKKKYSEECDCDIDSDIISRDDTEKLKNILLNNNLRKTTKKKSIIELFASNDECVKEYINMFSTIVTGGAYKLSKLDDAYKDIEDSISFQGNFDDIKDKIASILQDDFLIVEIAKSIYDFVLLNDLLGDENNISNVMCNIYDQHKKDLRLLKELLIDIDNNLKLDSRIYETVFKNKSLNNYSRLVAVDSRKRIDSKDFNDFISKILKANEGNVSSNLIENYNYLLKKAEDKTLLTIIAHYSTSLIPHQLHLLEFESIINNAAKVYPFLNEIKEKLVLLFKYRIHYSYGPLNDKSKYSNVERKSNERITPWNISQIIDDNKTKQKFMKRLTNSCSYLLGSKVMPKSSLIFEKYVILDKLNPMKVNGESLSYEEKCEVFTYLLSRPKTTLNQLKRFLSKRFNVKDNDVLISNIKETDFFEASSHCHLSKFFDINKESIEYYIYLATVYSDDKKALKNLLVEEYKELSNEQIKCILTLPTKKWASISSKLLTEIVYSNIDTGEEASILDVMLTTNNNFQMVLYHPQYRFVDLIEKYNSMVRLDVSDESIIEEMLEETPSIFRRSIHQTLLILNDIEKATKRKPDKIFIEVNRKKDDEKKGKETNPRIREVEEFIHALIKDSSTCDEALRLKEDYDMIDKTMLKNKHIYLYFKQMGRDMYTGLPIKIDDVIHSYKYDIDHIIPQSLIKDDSIDNMVLVDKNYNENIKKDIYPIPIEIRNESNLKFWHLLKEKKLISEKKYANLLRSSEISLEEIEDFVSRQINVVNYSNIVIKNILEIKYPDTKIVFSKSIYPSEIREYLQIAKNRDLNDTHHAIDAYLNVFCGNVLSTKYSDVRKIYYQKKDGEDRSFNMINTLHNVLKYQSDSSGVLYKDKIKSTCLRRDIIVTYKLDYNNGAFYNSTIVKASNSISLFPVHAKSPMCHTDKYGGYSDIMQSYIMAVEYEEKGRVKKHLLRVPIIYDRIYQNEELLLKVVNNDRAKNVKLIRKINLNQKIRWRGCEYLLYTSDERQNKYKMAYQNYLDNDYLNYLNKASKYIKLNLVQEGDIVKEIIINKKQDKFVISKEYNLSILNELINICNKKVYDSCNYIVKIRSVSIDKFISLSIKEQINIINQVIKCLSRKSEECNLSIIDGPKTCMLRHTNNISNEDITLIYESPTGLFSHEVKL